MLAAPPIGMSRCTPSQAHTALRTILCWPCPRSAGGKPYPTVQASYQPDFALEVVTRHRAESGWRLSPNISRHYEGLMALLTLKRPFSRSLAVAVSRLAAKRAEPIDRAMAGGTADKASSAGLPQWVWDGPPIVAPYKPKPLTTFGVNERRQVAATAPARETQDRVDHQPDRSSLDGALQ